MNLLKLLAPPAPMIRTVPISDGGFLVDLPGRLRTSREKDNTLAVHVPGRNFAVLRFSVLMLSLKLNPAALDLGLEHLRRLATKTPAEVVQQDGRMVASYQEEVTGPPPARMHYHFAASRNAVLVASVWMQQGKEQELEAQELLAACHAAVRSFRPNPLYGPDLDAKLAHGDLSHWGSAFLEERRRMVRRMVQERLNLPGLPPGEDGLPALQLLLDRKIVHKGDKAGLEALGVTFGDILAGKTGLAWALESEPRGDIPVLVVPGEKITVYATTLIWRRVDQDEKVELKHLLESLTEKLKAKK